MAGKGIFRIQQKMTVWTNEENEEETKLNTHQQNKIRVSKTIWWLIESQIHVKTNEVKQDEAN